MDVVVARSLLKVRPGDGQRFVEVDVPKTAQKVDLGAAQTAGLDAIQLDVIQLRLIVHAENVRQEKVIGSQPQVAGDRQGAAAAGGGLIGIPTEDSPIAQL